VQVLVQLDCNHAVPANIASADNRDKIRVLGRGFAFVFLAWPRAGQQGRAK
jgi:hypothetical protein